MILSTLKINFVLLPGFPDCRVAKVSDVPRRGTPLPIAAKL
jgi:hypothetical protein